MTNNARNITMADPFFSQEDRAQIHRGVEDILSGALSMGPHVTAFEREFSELVGVRHAIAMNACTSCLEVSLKGLGLEFGDEVIIPSATFIATGMSVLLTGGKPVFAELHPKTFCLDLEDVKRRVTARTRGVIIVYFAGLIPENMMEFRRFCDDSGLFLIEDAAHAPGALLGGKRAGAFSHAGCFSFYPTKVMTSGEGGMLTTNDDRLAEFARSLQYRGRDMSLKEEVYIMAGRNIRMTEFAALLGRVQLSHLEEYLQERRRVVGVYREMFSGDDRVQLILPGEMRASTYWKQPIVLDEKFDRQVVAQMLKDEGVTVDLTYTPPLHLQPVCKRELGTKEGNLPRTEYYLSHHLCLPCHPRMSNDDVKFVGQCFREALDAIAKQC